ncbi:uncharacterized protein LOC142230866 [Haematobia irritans]|uniref:uncharacterized protein LOC142230866 n=1 Tax=Haematobia irritans TaxID=7368 RepID=UPI003F4F86B1
MSKPVYKFFDKKSQNEFTCQIDQCKQAIRIIDKSPFNLERHVKRRHPEKIPDLTVSESHGASSSKSARIDDFFGVKPKPTNVLLHLNEKTLMDACVEMVTKNGRPFSIMNDSGFRKIIDPILTALNSKIAITPESVQQKIESLADSIKEEISTDVKNRLISLKIDAATCMDRSILGVNVQYIKCNTICIKTLAMKELKERHTGEYIKSVTVDILKEYNIKPEQIYSVTTDNGANMIKAVELLEERKEKLVDGCCEPDNDTLEIEDEGQENDSDDWSQENAEDSNLDLTECGISGSKIVRCAAHTLQLAFMKEFVAVLRPAKEATINLQAANLVVGDFFGTWIKMKLEISSMSASMAKDFMVCLSKREESLLGQPAVICALYLDPRYKSLLKEEAVVNAKQWLLETWRQIQHLKPTTQNSPSEGAASKSTTMMDCDLSMVDNFLQSQSNRAVSENYVREDDIKDKINDFFYQARISAQSSVLQFWDERRAHPLYELACVVLGVPATQVSVERNFSALKYIYNHLRCRLTEKSAVESHRILIEAYGDLALSEATCQRWFQRFRNNDFDVRNEERGRPPK